MNAWMLLVTAGLLEPIWAAMMKRSDGFTRLWPTLATLGISAISFFLLGRAIKTIPIGTGYAVWTGIGAAGTALVGILLFHEGAQPVRLFFIGLILVGMVGLYFNSPR
jgi:quaternary ammonium compound-resistance protein SugE